MHGQVVLDANAGCSDPIVRPLATCYRADKAWAQSPWIDFTRDEIDLLSHEAMLKRACLLVWPSTNRLTRSSGMNLVKARPVARQSYAKHFATTSDVTEISNPAAD